MKKIIIAFAAGQIMQLLVLLIGEKITYSTNLLPFCAAIGAVVTLALVVGNAGSLLEMAAMEPADPTADADEEIRKGPPLEDKELTTIFRRGWDKKEEEAENDV